MTLVRPTRWLAAALAATGVVALVACGGGSGSSVAAPGPSSTTTVSTTPAPTTASTTTPTTTASTTVPTTTVTALAVPPGFQRVTYSGVQFLVPTGWPVYDLTTDPTRCVRLDQHAVYLGQGGPAPRCPAQIVGHTDTVQVQPLNLGSQVVAARATQPQTLNGLSVRVDPNAAISGAFAVVFPAQQLVATITFGPDRAVAAQILQSVQHA